MREGREIHTSFFTRFDTYANWYGCKTNKADLLILPIEYYQLSVLDILEETRNLLAAHSCDERAITDDFS